MALPAPGTQGLEAEFSGLFCLFPRVADSDLTESDTDTKKLKGTGDGSEIKAEKLRKPSEVEAERLNIGRLPSVGTPASQPGKKCCQLTASVPVKGPGP